MIKNLAIFFALYILLNVFNLFLIDRAFAYQKKRDEVAKILSEINNAKNDKNYQFSDSYNNNLTAGFSAQIQAGDARGANLKAFFRKYNSPLYDYADKIVEVSDKYKFDYRLLPAIAMQESNLCNVIPADSYNCWGWGIYGTTVTRFDSYDDAIETIGKGIREQYIDQGLVTASAIMKKYTPPSSGSWQYGVNSFMKALE